MTELAKQWKNEYPYLLDDNLTDCIRIALKHGDKVRAKQLWDIFVSYRKSDVGEPGLKIIEEVIASGQHL